MEHRNPAIETLSPARRAFIHYLRTGQRLTVSAFEAKAAERETKFNPYHDPRNGRFTFAPGGPRSLRDNLASDRRQMANAIRLQPGDPALPALSEGASSADTISSPFTAGAISDGVYRPNSGENLLLPAQYRPNPRAGSGGNSRAFQDPMTLEQVFPGLSNAPGGSILAVADGFLDLTGPGYRLTTEMSRQYANVLINQIRAIDPNYRFNSLGFPETFEGQMNQLNMLRLDRAAALYRLRGEARPLQVETLRFLQRSTNRAYEHGLRKLEAGRLKVRLSPEEAVGNYVDQRVRDNLRQLYSLLGISMTRDQQIRVIGREYNTSGTDRTYRIPDARVGNVAFDITLARKTLAMPQIRGFFNTDFRPDTVVIIRPSQLGPNSSYIITRPRN